MNKLILKGLTSALIFLPACTKKQDTNANLNLTPEQLFEKGKQIYTANCVSCHGADPKKDGSIGPAIWGSSLELISHRVLTSDYPEGYKPKRSTTIMSALPYLQKDLPALHHFLNKE